MMDLAPQLVPPPLGACTTLVTPTLPHHHHHSKQAGATAHAGISAQEAQPARVAALLPLCQQGQGCACCHAKSTLLQPGKQL